MATSCLRGSRPPDRSWPLGTEQQPPLWSPLRASAQLMLADSSPQALRRRVEAGLTGADKMDEGLGE